MKKLLAALCASFVFGLVQADVVLPIPDAGTWNASVLQNYIGQVVTFDVPFYVCDNSSELIISPRRTYSPTNQALPASPEYANLLRLNATGLVTLSGVSQYHRMGEHILGLRARVNSMSSLTWVDGTWSGNSRADLEHGPDWAALKARGEYDLLVCGFNLEYYLVDDFDIYDSKGPESYDEHEKQRAKVSKALALINADIFGLVEVQQGQAAMQEIAEDLTANTGRHFAFVRDGTTMNGTFTKAGYVYCSDVVEPVLRLVEIGDVVSNRKFMQTFRVKATGERFILSINHFKAKSGAGTGRDADHGDGQGIFNYSRTVEAQAVLNRFRTFSVSVGEPDLLVMGDLNAYAMEDPIMTLVRNGLYDLHRAFHADSSYSYTFHGAAGYLDHALCNASMLPQVTGMTAFHINSDENDRYTYDTSSDLTMFRCSDHDPVLVGLRLDSTLMIRAGVTVNSAEVLTERQNIIIRNAYAENIPAFARLYTADGRFLMEEKIDGEECILTTPTASGVYVLMVYAGNRTIMRYKIVVP